MGIASVWIQLFLVAVIVWKEGSAREAGPYTTQVEELHKCEDQGLDLTKFEAIAYFIRAEDSDSLRKLLYKGHFSFPLTAEEVDHSTIYIKYEIRDNNEFKKYFEYEKKFCDALTGTGKEYYEIFRKASNITEEGCHIKPGYYEVNDWHVTFGVPTPQLHYGVYKILVQFKVKNQVYACIELIVDVKKKYD